MNNTDKNQWIELLKLYYEEWKFRQEELWKKAIQLLVIIFFTSTLPITISVFGSISISNIPMWVFPGFGILLTFFFLWYFLSKSLRINAIDAKRKRVIEMVFGNGFTDDDLLPFLERNRENKKEPLIIFKWRMSIWVPVILSAIEIAISIIMIILICFNKV